MGRSVHIAILLSADGADRLVGTGSIAAHMVAVGRDHRTGTHLLAAIQAVSIAGIASLTAVAGHGATHLGLPMGRSVHIAILLSADGADRLVGTGGIAAHMVAIGRDHRTGGHLFAAIQAVGVTSVASLAAVAGHGATYLSIGMFAGHSNGTGRGGHSNVIQVDIISLNKVDLDFILCAVSRRIRHSKGQNCQNAGTGVVVGTVPHGGGIVGAGQCAHLVLHGNQTQRIGISKIQIQTAKAAVLFNHNGNLHGISRLCLHTAASDNHICGVRSKGRRPDGGKHHQGNQQHR